MKHDERANANCFFARNYKVECQAIQARERMAAFDEPAPGPTGFSAARIELLFQRFQSFFHVGNARILFGAKFTQGFDH